jgi:ribosomal protein L11 methyltransferase
MPTYSALTTLKGRDAAQALGEMLEDLDPAPTGVGVFEMEDGSGLWEIGAYFVEEPDEVELMLAAAAHSAKPFVISEVPDTDWVAQVKRELTPVEAGRFFVYGEHDADKLPDTSIGLLIEAAMAFGTGHHGTTLGCLKALDARVVEGEACKRVADIGCGTAVLGMAASKVWDIDVLVSDIDPVAVDVAKANAEANGLADRLTCLESAGFDHPELAAAAPFDLVFASILMGPLLALTGDMARVVAPGGKIILSGILSRQAAAVIEAYEDAGFSLHRREENGDWTTLTLARNG